MRSSAELAARSRICAVQQSCAANGMAIAPIMMNGTRTFVLFKRFIGGQSFTMKFIAEMRNHQRALAERARYGVTIVVGCLYALLLAACTTNLKPAPEARTVSDGRPAALNEVACIRVTVMPDQWSGRPADLSNVAIPLRVSIENRSDQPLRIRYQEFRLVGPRSFTSTAIPPYKVEGTVIEPVFLP